TTEEMASASELLGHTHVAVTDHSQQLRIANGMNEEGFARQDREIAATNAALAAAGKTLRILRGIEMNLSVEGAGDMDQEFLDRQDLDVSVLHLAAETGCWISIGSDAHSTADLDVLPIGVGAAIRAGLKREQILNYLGQAELQAWVRSRRAKA